MVSDDCISDTNHNKGSTNKPDSEAYELPDSARSYYIQLIWLGGRIYEEVFYCMQVRRSNIISEKASTILVTYSQRNSVVSDLQYLDICEMDRCSAFNGNNDQGTGINSCTCILRW